MVLTPKLFQVIVLVVGSMVSISGRAQQCTWYPDDADLDGFGTAAGAKMAACHVAQPGFVLNNLDCNGNHYNDAEWTTIGSSEVAMDAVVSTDVEIAPDGTPYILYRTFTDPNPTAVLALKKFNGTNWVAVGPDPIDFSDYMFGADLALDDRGVPYVAFVDQDMGDKVTVIKYNGSSNRWDLVGSRAMSADAVIGNGTVRIALDENGIPHVFYVNVIGDAYVMRYNSAGNRWLALGGGTFATVGSSEYMLAIDGNNVPYVAFTDASDLKISVMRFTGSWQTVGNPRFSDDFVSSPRVAFDGSNNAYAAYFDEGTAEVVVQRYDAAGARWVKMGSAVSAGGFAEVSLVVDRIGVPYVAHNNNGNLTVLKWDRVSSAWTAVADRAFALGLNIAMVLAPNDLPYVSYRDLINSDHAFVKTITPILVQPGTPSLGATETSTCAGETTRLSITSGNLNDATQWVWYTGGCGRGVSLGAAETLDVAPTVTTTYYARAEGVCVLPGSCASITINVTPLPTAPTLSAASSAICPGATTQLSITGGTLGNATTQYWAWYETTCGVVSQRLGTATTTIDVTPSVNTTYYARGEGSCEGICTPITIQLVPYPVVTLSAAPTVCAGEAATIQVTSSTNATTFQWQTGSPWTDIPGETNASLTRQGTDLAVNNNDFRLVVKNSIGCEASFASSVTVLPQPTIGAAGQPADASICVGANTAFDVTATGANLTYQWQVDAGSGFNNITNGGIYTDATTARLQLTGATAAVDGYQYRAQITMLVGGTTYCSVVTSAAAVLTIDAGPSIQAGGQPVNTSICPNGSATFSVAATGVGLTYQWQENTGSGFTNVANGTSYSGVTTATLSVLNVPGAWAGRRYRVVIQSSHCGAVTSDGTATLSVTQGVSISGQPTSAVVCPGNAATFQVSVTAAAGLTYQWQEDDGSGFRDVTASGTYSGVTSSALAIHAVTAAMNARRYRVMLQRSGCASISSDGLAMLTVQAAPVIVNQPQGVTLCVGESGSTTVVASGPAVNYQWQVDDGSGFIDIRDDGVYSGTQTGTLTFFEPPLSMHGHGVRVALRWTCGDVLSIPSVLSVDPPPVVSAGPDQEIEQRGSVALEGAVPAGVTNFTWVELSDTPQAHELRPEVTPAADTRYTLSVIDNNGCTATDEVQVHVTPLFNIPNTFSPNHDGVNDAWVINGLEAFPQARIKVFNRYGAAVFASEQQPVSWDGRYQGKPLPWGTYYYTIDLQNGEKPLSGWVLILN